MKPIENWNLIDEAGEFKRLPPGIYGVVLTSVKDNTQGEYLEITCDITKGEQKGYFKALTDAGLKDSSLTYRSYKEKALPFFKSFITAVEKCNPGYHWNWDEKSLVGKNVIAVFGEEEYEDKNGDVKIATRCVEFRSVDAWKEGKIKVPELKKLPPKVEQDVQANTDVFGNPTSLNVDEIVDLPDDDLPF